MLEKQIAQARENSTSAVSVFSPATDQRVVIATAVICNTTAGAVTCQLFHDDDGTTYDESTALVFNKSIPANEILVAELRIAMNGNGTPGNLAYRSSVANALTITLYGFEV